MRGDAWKVRTSFWTHGEYLIDAVVLVIVVILINILNCLCFSSIKMTLRRLSLCILFS